MSLAFVENLPVATLNARRVMPDVRQSINYGESGFGGKRKTFEVNEVDSI
jgi:hypothetical protein